MKTHCAHTKMVAIEKLKPHPRNPNKHPKKQIELLSKIIKEQGWRQCITVSKRSGYIVRGHGRLEAGKLAGCKTVPVDFQDYDTDAAEYADMIADNKLADLAELDTAILKDILQDIDDGSIDMDLTGFDTTEIEQMMLQTHDSDKDSESQRCPHCGKEI